MNGFVSERRDSNPRPRPWQGRALPAELLSHYFRFLQELFCSTIPNPLAIGTIGIERANSR